MRLLDRAPIAQRPCRTARAAATALVFVVAPSGCHRAGTNHAAPQPHATDAMDAALVDATALDAPSRLRIVAPL